jgi:transposase
MTSKTTNKFLPEVRARVVRMVLDHETHRPSRWAAIVSVSSKIGGAAQSLHQWIGRAERDSGRKPGLTMDIAAEMNSLEREVRELRQANGILRNASAYFAQTELDRMFKR